MINLTPFDKCKQNITMHKDGKYIILQKDSEINKKYYRYNLSTNTFERVNINEYKTNISPQKVEYMTGWIKDCNFQTKDNKFARMFFFTKASPHLRRFRSIIRYIEHLGDKDTVMFEYIDSLNLNLPFINDVIDKQKRFMSREYKQDEITIVYKRFKKNKTNIKAIRKITKELNRGITIDEFIYFTNLQDESKLDLFIELKHYSEMPSYLNCFIANTFRYGRGHQKHIFNDTEEFKTFANTVIYIDKIMEIIKEFNLNVEVFVKWLNKMYFIEKVTLNDSLGTNHYQDYLRMQKDIHKGKMPKINKYPTNFMTEFHRTQHQHKIIKQKIDEEKFNNEVEKNKHLQYNNGFYTIMLPRNPNDIAEEGDMLHHCVRSYIQPMTEGKTCILFLRDNKNVESPLVTIECKDNQITQAYGAYDKKPKEKELDVIRKWAEIKNIKLNWNWS